MELNDWQPLLVAAWRRLRGARLPEDQLGHAPLSAAERRDILAGATRLSQGLTRERELAGARYFDDPQLLGAYLLLYWPVSYAQARSVLPEMAVPLGTVLDIGSGPAPLALAALDLGAKAAWALDRSELALGVGRGLARDRGTALSVQRWQPGNPFPDGPFDTILVGHVLNELFGDDFERRYMLLYRLLLLLRSGGCLVVIEPALRETSRALLTVRDRLVAAGATIRAPCLFRGNCPALERESDWCHAERPFTPPPVVAELADAAQLHRESLKMTYLIVQSPGAQWPGPRGRLFRIVSEPLGRKGQHRFIGCGPEGRVPLVLPTKHVRDANRVFTELRRGDVIDVEGLEPRGDGLRLSDRTWVERIAPVGTPVDPWLYSPPR